MTGGDTGPAIVPGKPEESLLIAAIRYENDYLEMPPKERLPAAKIKLLEDWVQRGAPGFGASDEPATNRPAIDIEAGRRFWAYRPLASAADNRNPNFDIRAVIDEMVRAKLDAAGLAPIPTASPEVLARRLCFDLHGLPPTVEQLDAFVGDTRADAFERLVDALLASPNFGERWGRHWLDIARFGESLTLRGFVLPEAWRYRDYVIDAFNADRPFDQFLREQIAGDQRRPPALDGFFVSLGEYRFEKAGQSFVLIATEHTDGHVIADAVQFLPEMFAVFDFADPSMVVDNRNVSTVAPQALYLMNHPFVIERSTHAAQ